MRIPARMVHAAVSLALVPLVAAPATAQTLAGSVSTGVASSTPGAPDLDFSARYSFEHISGFDPGRNKTAVGGFAVDIGKRLGALSKTVDIHGVGEFALNAYGDKTPVTFRGGARFVFLGHGTITPLVQILAGLWHCGVCEENIFTLMPGAGMDVALGDKPVRFRVLFSFPMLFDDVLEKGIRVDAGIALSIGHK